MATKEAAFRKLARTAGRVLLFAWEGLEAMAVANNPRTMTVSLHRVAASALLPAETKAWIKSPDDETAMLYSFVAAFRQQKLAVHSGRDGSDEGYFGGWGDEGVADAGSPRCGGAGSGGSTTTPSPRRQRRCSWTSTPTTRTSSERHGRRSPSRRSGRWWRSCLRQRPDQSTRRLSVGRAA